MEFTVADRPVRRLTADEVMRMSEAGILPEDKSCELLHGVLTEVNPPGPEHSTVQSRLLAWLGQGASEGRYVLRVDAPVLLPDRFSLPQPDIAVVPGDLGTVRPHPREVLLAIEISLSSLRVDLSVKRPLYAQAEFPEYWIIDARHGRLLVLTDPADGEYRREETLTPGDRARPRLVDAEPLDVAALLAGL